jgi:hypothetical protein
MNPAIIRQPVFVILPIRDRGHAKRIYDDAIVPALDYFGFDARRSDNQAEDGTVTDLIVRQIQESFFLVADLSQERPNCYYEVGYAHGIKKPVLLVNNIGSPPHFDLQGYRIHEFDESTAIKDLIVGLIPKFLISPLRSPKDTHNRKFGRHCIVNGYRCCAEVSYCDDNECYVTLEVISLDVPRLLDGKVIFHLHESYHQSSRHILAKNNRAIYEITAHDGPFTVGAVVLNDDTRLELDLATIPGAQKWWYDEAYKRISP